ncbi:hypothetical protein C806_04531 [Lachnospiraceae bacterium 3-1]|nr:hypothetical protein C806_04531 [Lachnospiraceae bacterium 3-1]
MTELQVKTKKGSLKKFFAMFLAVCVCMTTIQMNGMFVSAEESGNQQDVTPEIAIKNKEIKAENGTTVDLVKAGGVVTTPDNATIDWTTSDATAKIAINDGVVSPGDAKDFKVEITGTIKVGEKVAKDTVTVQFGTVTEKPEVIPVTGVTLSAPTLSLEIGKSSTLTATVAPANASNKAVTWKSNNTGVATVNNGKVTAVKAGSATITVTTVDGSKTATCAVTVKPAAPTVYSVTGVTLSAKTLSLEVGKSSTLTATVVPANASNKAVTWKSSNAGVATVNNGKVTAVKAGSATITVTTADGNKTATCAVTVKAAPVKVKKVTLSASKLYIVANKSVTVGVGIEPSNAKNKAVTWKSKSTKVATVNSKGKITAKKNAAGKNTTITATAKDGSKKSASVKVYVVKRATKITKVTLPKTAKVDVKGTVALKATLKPAKATVDSKTLKWSSSDTKVATVKDGVVTGKKAGVATITVKAGKKSAKCVVTVTKKGVKATLQKTKATVKVKKTYQIKLKGKGDSIVDCKTSNKKVATVTKKGKITGKKKGTATITVITKKGGVATFKVTVKK